MDNRQKARSNRGQIAEGYEVEWQDLSSSELISLLEDPSAAVRSAAARLLGYRRESLAIAGLCDHLKKETALYSRLEICTALNRIGEPALPALISLLGQIGQNQHNSLPEKGFRKRSYPLPRDLAARVIIRMGSPALPMLEEVVREGDPRRVREAVDAIGHISYIEKTMRSEAVLIAAYQSAQGDPVLQWKLIRAFQSFPSEKTRLILISTILQDSRPPLRWEAVRSLGLMTRDIPSDVLKHARNDPDGEVRSLARLFMG